MRQLQDPKQYRISDVGRLTGLTPDTLRYYEKIGLLPRVGRVGGIRLYNDKDVSRLRFIQRTQKMDFTLAEIGTLLKMRDAPQSARKSVRELTAKKLAETETHLGELKTLRNELQLLLNLCNSSRKDCGILKELQ
ncbi:MAG: heavy metal-responsive transcriptional regulator [Betaproteobacteria bacterium RBG_16_66_20]|nr:MAG: heavy metal-responsive transcriptional regulator [Betaproteobacteria bacterium RBG_16_66_20]